MRRAAFAALVLGAWTQQAAAQDDREVLAGDPVTPSQDDLGKATDATADVAIVEAPSVEPEGPVPLQPSSDAIDLDSLGLDASDSGFDDKLNLYGFADIGYNIYHWTRNPVFFAQDSRSFNVGNLDLYVAKNVTQRARALAEVRFTFLPNGTRNLDNSFVSTDAEDLTDRNRKVQWGGIMIERAYVEYDLTENLTIRGGHWLTPYGIWNTDHGSPVFVGIIRPYIVGQELFPEHQTGLDLFGSHYQDGFKLSYHLTASNGRGATEAVVDRDVDLALGGRLELETPWGLKAGASYYRGRYTGIPAKVGEPQETYREAAYGGDAQFDLGPLHVQGEVIARERHYEAEQRVAVPAGFAPDSRALGAYLLVGYRFNRFWNVMPFTYGGPYRPIDHQIAGGYDINLGLNFRPSPGFVLKLQTSRIRFSEGSEFLGGQHLFVYGAQASWMF